MDRKQRMRIAAAMVIGMASLFVAFIGAPMLASLFWPVPQVPIDAETMMDSFNQASRTALVANRVSMAAFAVAGLSFLYVTFLAMANFVGPREPAENLPGH